MMWRLVSTVGGVVLVILATGATASHATTNDEQRSSTKKARKAAKRKAASAAAELEKAKVAFEAVHGLVPVDQSQAITSIDEVLEELDNLRLLERTNVQTLIDRFETAKATIEQYPFVRDVSKLESDLQSIIEALRTAREEHPQIFGVSSPLDESLQRARNSMKRYVDVAIERQELVDNVTLALEETEKAAIEAAHKAGLPRVPLLGAPPPRCVYSPVGEKSGRFLIKGWLCPQVGAFEPRARVFFDTGTDEENEVDIFQDGSLAPAIQMFSLYFASTWSKAGPRGWTWGIELGAGITSPAQDGDDNGEQASDAPIVLYSAGLRFEFPLGRKNAFGLEYGKAIGFSTDESVNDNDDSARYAGVFFKIRTN